MCKTTRRKPNRNQLLESIQTSSDPPQAEVSEVFWLAQFWDVEQLAKCLGVPKSWIYERTRKNRPEVIPHFKLGKYLRFSPSSQAFRAWLKSHEIAPSSSLNHSERSKRNKEMAVRRRYTCSRLSDRASHKEGGENDSL